MKNYNKIAIPDLECSFLGLDCYVYIIDLFSENLRFKKIYDLLSESEKDKVSLIKSKEKKHLFLMKKGIVRKILSHYIDLKPHEITYRYNNYGKPYLAGEDNIYFNISHSGKYLAIAISKENEVGIDIQIYKNTDKIYYAMNSVFTYEEKQFVLNEVEEEQIFKFTYIWSRKEAFCKCIGKGLLLNLKDIPVIERFSVYKEVTYLLNTKCKKNEYSCSIAIQR